MKHQNIKLLPFIIFFVLIFNIPTTRAIDFCWDNNDCSTCNGCLAGICIKATSDSRCSTMCENGNCAKRCAGTCKQQCDSTIGDLPGDPFTDGECFENGNLSGLQCCVSGGATQTCTGVCRSNYCSIGSEEQDSSGTCFHTNEVCCIPIDTHVQLETDNFTPNQNDINNSITNSLTDVFDEVTPLESGSNPTKSVLFTGITCIDSGNCSVDDMMLVGINLTRFLLGIIGSVALFFFMFAGFKMLTSRGNEKDITSAKQMMTQTILGILVFLSAYIIVTFIQKSLLNSTYMEKANLNQATKATDTCKLDKGNGWSCQSCGSLEECTKKVSKGTCVKGKCPGDDTNLCCK